MPIITTDFAGINRAYEELKSQGLKLSFTEFLSKIKVPIVEVKEEQIGDNKENTAP